MNDTILSTDKIVTFVVRRTSQCLSHSGTLLTSEKFKHACPYIVFVKSAGQKAKKNLIMRHFTNKVYSEERVFREKFYRASFSFYDLQLLALRGE